MGKYITDPNNVLIKYRERIDGPEELIPGLVVHRIFGERCTSSATYTALFGFLMEDKPSGLRFLTAFWGGAYINAICDDCYSSKNHWLPGRSLEPRYWPHCAICPPSAAYPLHKSPEQVKPLKPAGVYRRAEFRERLEEIFELSHGDYLRSFVDADALMERLELYRREHTSYGVLQGPTSHYRNIKSHLYSSW